jgi:Tannase-like family of unknown function (DUF6351)
MAAMLLDLINHWLDNMAASPSPLTMEKVVSNKPPSAADTCWDLSGNKNGAGHPVQHDLSSLQSPAATGWTGVDQISLEVHLKPINFKDYEVILRRPKKLSCRASSCMAYAAIPSPALASCQSKARFEIVSNSDRVPEASEAIDPASSRSLSLSALHHSDSTSTCLIAALGHGQ